MKIESDVPIPPRGAQVGGRKPRYPFHEMAVGESILIKDKSTTVNRLSTRLNQILKATGKRFTQRSGPDGIRVWRIE